MRRLGSTAYEELLELEKCPECRAKLVDSGGEVACPSCGMVLGASQALGDPLPLKGKPEVLGSYVGRMSGVMSGSQVGCVFGTTKLRANCIGRDLLLLQSSTLITRVANRFFLPKGIIKNAVLTSERLLPYRKLYHVTAPAISAYSLFHSCRSAGISHVGFDELLKAFSEAGHRITTSQLLRIGSESPLPLPAIRPEALVGRVVTRLQSNVAVAERVRKARLNECSYFANLLQGAKAIATELGELGAFSPKTIAACSVYLAGMRIGPKTINQREAAETLGIAEFTVRELCSRFRKRKEARRGR